MWNVPQEEPDFMKNNEEYGSELDPTMFSDSEQFEFVDFNNLVHRGSKHSKSSGSKSSGFKKKVQ